GLGPELEQRPARAPSAEDFWPTPHAPSEAATLARMSKLPSRRLLLWLVAIGFFMQTLDSTIVNTALPSMARDLGESPLRMQAVVIAYALTMAILIPASGWIADRFGVKRAYIGAISVFVIGSLACALSTTMTQLV